MVKRLGFVGVALLTAGTVLATGETNAASDNVPSAVYCVIDLSGGTSATSYPVSYLAAAPTGGWTDAYKTTKLVFRRIEAGSFIMGNNQTDESRRITLTKPYYVGVFEVTQKQWELVMGSNPSSYAGDMRPVECVSYNDIRGSSVGTNWPSSSAVDATSFLGKLRAKTGLDGFDLPTEAQWEYACRAGRTSTYNNGGDTEDDLKTLGRYYDNKSDGRGGYTSAHTTVGAYAPNAWGLYDMHGNVWEWCLDWDGTLVYSADPVGSSSGSYRVRRGGSWNAYESYCTSSSRLRLPPSNRDNDRGFRLVCLISSVGDSVSDDSVSDENSGSDDATSSSVPTISDLTVTPVAPWGLALDYTVSGATAAETTLPVVVTATADGTNYTARHLSGATNWVNGSHRVYWNMAKDGITATVADSEVTVAFTDVRSDLYCVVDLSGGTSAASYPVSYLSAKPADGWTPEYKTTKLVLRRVEAGTFIMGDDQTNESHRVTLTKPFYVGVFEVTQKQWELVMGSNPSYYTGDARPVEQVSYNDIRGSSAGAGWPALSAVDATSFLGKLRTKTGLDDFDLPTDAQWEYACRAGATSTYNNGGDTEDDLKTLGRYWDNRSDGLGGYTDAHTAVGLYMSNAWGLYDMHGNVREWCLDWYGSLSYGTDPEGSSSGSCRVSRGGSWSGYADFCASSDRVYDSPSRANCNLGFRLVRTLNNKTE